MTDCVLPHAPKLPSIEKLRGKRFILASSSPRRAEILHTFGLKPEINKSQFDENLSHADFDTAEQYVIATATEKGLEVYTRLVKEDEENPPDVVLSADTVIVHPSESALDVILEKPRDKTHQFDMLSEINAKRVRAITAMTIIQPQISTPGYSLQSRSVITEVQMADVPEERIIAYIDTNEGIDRAGGFAIQGLGGMLVKGIEGDYNNIVGLPAFEFLDWLDGLEEDGLLCNM